MTITWTPNPATIPWIIEQDNVPFNAGTISVVDSTPKVVTGYSYSMTGPGPLDDIFITTSVNGVSISAPNALPRAFPTEDIQYEINTVQYHVKSFVDLPNDYENVIAYKPCTTNTKEWTLHIVATFVGNTTQTANYIIKIYTDYTPGRDKLKAAIDARRN